MKDPEAVSQGIDDFISRHRPKPVCERCILGGVGMPDDAIRSAEITRALATSGDFVQERGECSLCGIVTNVIRRF